jgi:ADP-heptose:LPS heptosyltransferase
VHILASNPDALGDFVLRQPMFGAILESRHRLTLIVRSHVAPLVRTVFPTAEILELAANPYVPSFDPANHEFRDLLRKAREANPDLILIAPYQWTRFEEALMRGLPHLPVIRMSGVRFPPRGRRLNTSNHTIVRTPADASEVAKNEMLARAVLGAPVKLAAPRIETHPYDLREAREQLARLDVNPERFLVASVSESANRARNWTTEKWAALLSWAAAHFSVDLVLTGLPEEFHSTERVRELVDPAGHKVLNLCGLNGSVHLLIGLLASSRGYIGRDTGTAHLAAALGKPVIAVYGSGDGPRFLPNTMSGVVVRTKVPCSNCGWLCPFSEPYCIRTVPVQAVIDAAKNVSLDCPNGLRIHELNPVEIATPEVLRHLNTIGAALGLRIAWASFCNLTPELEGITSDSKTTLAAPELNSDNQTALAKLIVTVQSHLDSLRMAASQTVQQIGSPVGESAQGEERVEARQIVLSLEREIRERRDALNRMHPSQAEWQSREARLEGLLAAKTAENQFLRSRTDIDRVQMRLQADDLRKQIALKDAELARIHTGLRELLAEHTRVKEQQQEWERRHEAEIRDLQAQVDRLHAEAADLRHALETSLALRLARSLQWLFGPIKKWIA